MYFQNDVSKMLRTAVRLKSFGYTCEELIEHLEKQFQPGMSWQNYGSAWQIDHIVPVSSPQFDFSCASDPDFAKCWDLRNLRPLSRRDNTSKGTMSEAEFKLRQAVSFIDAL